MSMPTVTAAPVLTPTRVVSRGANPFAPIVIQQNQSLTPTSTQQIYEPLVARGKRAHTNANVQKALDDLRARLNGEVYKQEHTGKVITVKIGLIDINFEIQRDEDAEHHANIIRKFDPRIYMPVMCTKLATGRYSAWEGQQTACVLYHLWKAGLIEDDFEVQIKYFDEDLEVPGSDLKGEAVGNYGFRQINGGMRKPIDAYHLHRSRVNGVRLYNSQFDEDRQSEEIQCIMERNSMFPAKPIDARGRNATPGMVTYLHGVNLIAGHGTDMSVFNLAKTDLEWALKWHNTYFPNEKGVEGGFILAFGRLHHAARTQTPSVTIDSTTEAELYQLFRSKYGTPSGFHNDCKTRLTKWQEANGLKTSWSDGCLTPLLVMDYIKSGGKCVLPKVPGMMIYAGI